MKKFLLALPLALCLLLSGCWNYRELESLCPVICTAVDLTEDGNWLLTSEIVNVSGVSPSASLVTSQGQTVFEAVRSQIEQSSRRLYWGDAAVMVLSKKVAERGICDAVDFIARDHELRSNMIVLISAEPTAQELLLLDTPNNTYRGNAIKSALASMEQVSKTPAGALNHIFGQLKEKGQTLVLPAASLSKSGNKQLLEVAGSACLEGGKLYGFLSPEDTFKLLLITGDAKGGVLNIRLEKGGAARKDGFVALEIKKCDTKTVPTYQNGRFAFDISLSIQAALNDVETENAEFAQSAAFSAYAGRQLAHDLADFIKTNQKGGADLFRFAATAKRELPAAYRHAEKSWQRYYANADVRVEAKIQILTHSGATAQNSKEES